MGVSKREGRKESKTFGRCFLSLGILLCIALVLHCELGVGGCQGLNLIEQKPNAGRLRPRAVDACDGLALGETLLEAVALEAAGRITWQFLALQGREEASSQGLGSQGNDSAGEQAPGGVRDGSPCRQQE